MYYSAVGLLAIMVLLIENRNLLFKTRDIFDKPAWKVYRRFLFAVLAYYVVDALRGLFESRKLALLLFADMTVYFAAMAAGVLFWSQFTTVYLEEKNEYGQLLVLAGRLIAGGIALLTAANIFTPVLFTVNAECVYRALPVRHVILVVQILLLLLISCYAVFSLRSHPANSKIRHYTLTLFGLIMALFLFIQLWFPYLPLYSAAYMLGTCLVHTFVVNSANEKYRHDLAQADKLMEMKDTIVCLLDNMPAMTFTKDAETGVYLACNQAFAKYANKDDPAGVIGLTASEIFDADTARQFDGEDKIALSMDEPYIFYEDVLDAAGNRRQLQTTKLKYTNFAGQLCVMGICQDVTDMVRVQREKATTKEDYEKAKSTGIIYSHISHALTRGFSVLYYVNLDTEEFTEYRNDEGSDTLTESRHGWHFFEAFRIEAESGVHPEDREAVIRAMKRKALEAALDRNSTFVITYRMMTEGEPRYYSMKVSRSEDDARCIILGVTDVDEHMQQRRAAVQVKEEQIAYARIHALAGDYLCLYIVDPQTGRYREFSAAQSYNAFAQAKEGTDFFKTTREAARQFNHPDDLNRFLSIFTLENVLAEIGQRGIFTLNYRLMMNGQPLYVLLKAAMVEEEGDKRLVIGIIDIDSQVRQEETYVQNLAKAQINANIDPLTHVKNRHAYLEAEERLNRQIAERRTPEFSIAILDVNDLKKVNDTAGHNAGDQYVQDACKIICDTFKHSPFYRIGGDEFAVISQGNDYLSIEQLVEQVRQRNESARKSGGIVIACGMAKYENDAQVSSVFERADHRMYENKSKLKANSIV
ncbi:MAG: diguanylate cyclase [Clostridia bacterium]|nr:diguanylate cyclase [Clostridia bacterium]